VLLCTNMAVVGPLEFSKLTVCHVTSIAMLLRFPVQNFTKIGQLAAELWPKNDLSNGGHPRS